MSDKAQLRSAIRERIVSMEPEARIVLDAGIATQITHLPAWKQATTVLGYLAMDDEVDLQAVLAAARRAGRTVGLPRVESGSQQMSFHAVTDIRTDLEPHPHGFMMPAAEAPRVEADAQTLVLVPGRAFDRAGYRVGRGGGFYDRFLTGLPAGVQTVGVAYAVQLVPAVPREGWDRPVQVVVTDSETCFCSRPDAN